MTKCKFKHKCKYCKKKIDKDKYGCNKLVCEKCEKILPLFSWRYKITTKDDTIIYVWVKQNRITRVVYGGSDAKEILREWKEMIK